MKIIGSLKKNNTFLLYIIDIILLIWSFRIYLRGLGRGLIFVANLSFLPFFLYLTTYKPLIYNSYRMSHISFPISIITPINRPSKKKINTQFSNHFARYFSIRLTCISSTMGGSSGSIRAAVDLALILCKYKRFNSYIISQFQNCTPIQSNIRTLILEIELLHYICRYIYILMQLGQIVYITIWSFFFRKKVHKSKTRITRIQLSKIALMNFFFLDIFEYNSKSNKPIWILKPDMVSPIVGATFHRSEFSYLCPDLIYKLFLEKKSYICKHVCILLVLPSPFL